MLPYLRGISAAAPSGARMAVSITRSSLIDWDFLFKDTGNTSSSQQGRHSGGSFSTREHLYSELFLPSSFFYFKQQMEFPCWYHYAENRPLARYPAGVPDASPWNCMPETMAPAEPAVRTGRGVVPFPQVHYPNLKSHRE